MTLGASEGAVVQFRVGKRVPEPRYARVRPLSGLWDSFDRLGETPGRERPRLAAGNGLYVKGVCAGREMAACGGRHGLM